MDGQNENGPVGNGQYSPSPASPGLVGTGQFLAPREVLAVLPSLLLAILLAMLDNLIVSTALPRIVGDLHGLSHLPWVITAYILGTTVSTPLWGKLGDLYGRKGVFLSS